MSTTKIISWNVNGLRAIHRKGAFDQLINLNADIYCLQEIKATESDLVKKVKSPDGFHTHFHSSETRKGYSGTAIYSKVDDEHTFQSKFPSKYKIKDDEGRLITLHFPTFTLVTAYFPNGAKSEEHFQYKLNFYYKFLDYINDLRKQGEIVIFCGDLNVAHTEIDLARPKENKNSIGFLEVERSWVDELIKNNWVDTFRYFNPKKTDSYTYWDTISRARDRNVGWRIDYFFIDKNHIEIVKNIKHHTDFLGSDHCPIELEITI